MNILIDPEDIAIWEAYPWCFSGRYYIYNDGIITRSLHREIMKATDAQVVDHRNGDTTDNRRHNLRIGTQSDNMGNRVKGMCAHLTSKYKGVSYDAKRRHFKAYITRYGVREYLGKSTCEHEAAKLYNVAAVRLFGEFALLNILKEES